LRFAHAWGINGETSHGHEWVYAFIEGDGKNKQLLGSKGANLCEMARIGLKVRRLS
jgi:pyruvate,orthophosphate dikinase